MQTVSTSSLLSQAEIAHSGLGWMSSWRKSDHALGYEAGRASACERRPIRNSAPQADKVIRLHLEFSLAVRTSRRKIHSPTADLHLAGWGSVFGKHNGRRANRGQFREGEKTGLGSGGRSGEAKRRRMDCKRFGVEEGVDCTHSKQDDRELDCRD